jgi:hypothetical protein
LDHSVLAKAIVNHTPILSQQIKGLWNEYFSCLNFSLAEKFFFFNLNKIKWRC